MSITIVKISILFFFFGQLTQAEDKEETPNRGLCRHHVSQANIRFCFGGDLGFSLGQNLRGKHHYANSQGESYIGIRAFSKHSIHFKGLVKASATNEHKQTFERTTKQLAYQLGVLGQDRAIFAFGILKAPFGLDYLPHPHVIGLFSYDFIFYSPRHTAKILLDNRKNFIGELAYSTNLSNKKNQARDDLPEKEKQVSLRFSYDLASRWGSKIVVSTTRSEQTGSKAGLGVIHQGDKQQTVFLEWLVAKQKENRIPINLERVFRLFVMGPREKSGQTSIYYEEVLHKQRTGSLLHEVKAAQNTLISYAFIIAKKPEEPKNQFIFSLGMKILL